MEALFTTIKKTYLNLNLRNHNQIYTTFGFTFKTLIHVQLYGYRPDKKAHRY